MPDFETEITLRVRVEYNVLPGERGSRDRYGLPETPDIPDDIEITAIVPLDEWLIARSDEMTVKHWQLPAAMREQLEDDAEDDARNGSEYEP
jgi:hypothetical protein